MGQQDWLLVFPLSLTFMGDLKQIPNSLALCFINYKWGQCWLLPAFHGVIKIREIEFKNVFWNLRGKCMEHKHFSILQKLV